MNGHSLRIATATAMEECLITAITKTAMLTALHDQPKFSELFMAYLLTSNSRIEEDLIDQLFNSSEKRLARLLLLLANFGKEGSPQPISPNISQETLAEMIGKTRSRVSFFMNKFRKLGFITYNGKIEVNSSLLNAVLYDKPEISASRELISVAVIDRHVSAEPTLSGAGAQLSSTPPTPLPAPSAASNEAHDEQE